MNDDVKAALNSVPHRITNPELIPAERYYDPAFFKLEKEKLWPHVWQMACRLEEIPNVGDYVEYTILAKSVIIVNTKNGVKAFHNACRHRGVRLATGPGNCKTRALSAPFTAGAGTLRARTLLSSANRCSTKNCSTRQRLI